jgi:hypothetical protein
MLVLSIPEYFHKLLQNGSLAAVTALRELCRVMVMTVDLVVVLVVTVLGAKDSRTHRTCEVIYMVLAL